MKYLSLIFILIMVLLGAFVFTTAVRIEILNAQAGFYMPRQDRQPDGTLADGKWRVSGENTPRDQLRGVVEPYGLMQYVMAPLLLAIAALVVLKEKIGWAKVIGATGVVVAVVALWLMFYREYFSSLGW